jgi:hypothetical protein
MNESKTIPNNNAKHKKLIPFVTMGNQNFVIVRRKTNDGHHLRNFLARYYAGLVHVRRDPTENI